MTQDELRSLIESTAWFSRIGKPDYDGQPAYFPLPNLEEWRDMASIPEDPPRLYEAGMARLPMGMAENDPIHGNNLEERADALGKLEEMSMQSIEISKVTLASLRKFRGHPLLKVGAHDFTTGAKGAALFAARRASLEIVTGETDYWCGLMTIFSEGHWPYGILPDGQIVVL